MLNLGVWKVFLTFRSCPLFKRTVAYSITSSQASCVASISLWRSIIRLCSFMQTPTTFGTLCKGQRIGFQRIPHLLTSIPNAHSMLIRSWLRWKLKASFSWGSNLPGKGESIASEQPYAASPAIQNCFGNFPLSI